MGLIGSYVEYISTNQSASLLSVGILVTIFSASKAVRALSRALNTAYGVKDNRNFFFQLIFSMAFILVLGFVIIIMIVLVAFSSDVVERMASAMKISFALVNVVSVWRWVTLVVVMFFALCMMYKFAPHKKLRFKEIIPGTIFSMAGFMLLTVGFSIYVTYFMRGSALYLSLIHI